MDFRLGVFDVFANAVPGAVILTVGSYVGWRTYGLDVGEILEQNAVVLVVLGFTASMITGILIFPLARRVVKHIWPDEQMEQQVVAEFRRRSPAHADSEFVLANKYFLLRGLQAGGVQGVEVIEKYRADGILLRNTAIGFALASITAAVEVFTSTRPVPAAISCLALALATYHALRESNRRSHWAHSSTLDFAAWWWGSDLGGTFPHSDKAD